MRLNLGCITLRSGSNIELCFYYLMIEVSPFNEIFELIIIMAWQQQCCHQVSIGLYPTDWGDLTLNLQWGTQYIWNIFKSDPKKSFKSTFLRQCLVHNYPQPFTHLVYIKYCMLSIFVSHNIKKIYQ